MYYDVQVSAEPNVPCFDGNTPLHLAVGKDQLGLAALLVAASADPYLENYECVSDEEQEVEQQQQQQQEEEEEEEPQGLTPMDLAAGNIKVSSQHNVMLLYAEQRVQNEC